MTSSLNTQISKVLLISGDETTADRVLQALGSSHGTVFEVQWVKLLSAGLVHLARRDVAAVLFSFSLPDSEGMATFDRLFAATPETPLLILSEVDQEELALLAVTAGAQDYLLPDYVDDFTLPRALRHAIERKAVEDALYLEKERAVSL